MNEENIIEFAKEAGIVLRLTDDRVSVQKLTVFANLVKTHLLEQGYRLRKPEGVDVTKAQHDTNPDLSQFGIYNRGPDIYSGDKPYGSTRGFLWFWLKPEGGVYKPGFNLTILRGFALTLVAFGKKYRFRYRKNISPKFLWSVE